METKSLLVTGAAGFIGSFLTEALLKLGYRVIGIDNLFRGSLANLSKAMCSKDFQFIKMDLSEADSVSQLRNIIISNQISTVFHLAAINGTQYFYDQPFFVLNQNILLTQNTLAATMDTPVEYLIYTSSSEVYGDPIHLPTKEDDLISLKTMADRDSYAASKALGDYYFRIFAESYNKQYLIARIFNQYGPRMVGTAYGQVIPEFISRMLDEKEFTIIGDGSQTRSFCYIDDAVYTLIQLFQKKYNGVINVGNNDEITILQLARIIHQVANLSFRPHFLPPRKDDPKRRCPDISKLMKAIPELQFTKLTDGIQKTIDYYHQHKS